MAWRGPHGGYDGVYSGYKVIKASNWYLYFDYKQAKEDSIGAPYDRMIPLDSTYAYTPIRPEYTPEQAALVIGVQGNLWTEYIKSFRDAQYMALPRMAALAELQWTDAPKDFDGFKKRLEGLIKVYDAEGYNYRPL